MGAGKQNVTQGALQCDGVRRGIESWRQLIHQPLAQSADHCAAPAEMIEALRDPLAGGRLAVRAGDSHYPQACRGIAENLPGDCAGMRLEMPDAEVGQTPLVAPGKSFAFPEHCRCATRNGIGNEIAAIAHCPGVGHEGACSIHFAAICAKVLQGERSKRGKQTGIESGAIRVGRCGWSGVVAHYPLPCDPLFGPLERFVAAAGVVDASLNCASGGMENCRSAPAMMLAKTGAATSPP